LVILSKGRQHTLSADKKLTQDKAARLVVLQERAGFQ
jgi:hypothetical protein